MDASLERDGTAYTLSVERELAHEPEKVWRALTEGSLLEQWFPCRVEGVWEVGAPLRFVFLHGEGDGMSDEELSGEVLSSDPPHSLSFRWGTYTISYRITPGDTGCTFSLSETLHDPAWGARSAAGWEMCLENLDLILEGASLAKVAARFWWARFDHYAEKFGARFGPQAGPPEDHPMLSEEGAPE